jgi:lipid-A-disaccharide synthase-like uncharacterized protein
MSAVRLTAEWAAWVATLAAPLHRRSAWRLAHVVGILLAHGRRTVASWWRAAGVGEHFGSSYYFLGSVGRKATAVAAVIFGLLRDRIDPACYGKAVMPSLQNLRLPGHLPWPIPRPRTVLARAVPSPRRS